LGWLFRFCLIRSKQLRLLSRVRWMKVFQWWLQRLQQHLRFQLRIFWSFRYLMIFILWFQLLIRWGYRVKLICFQHQLLILKLFKLSCWFHRWSQWFRLKHNRFFCYISKFQFRNQLHQQRVFSQLLISWGLSFLLIIITS